ncbi:hypothetical protein M1D99_12535 [Pseudomonas sp. R3-41]
MQNAIWKGAPWTPFQRREIRQCHRDVSTSRLGLELIEHRLRGVDAMHINAAFAHGQCESTRPYTQLQHRATATGQCHQGINRVRWRLSVQVIIDVGQGSTVSTGIAHFHFR